jgi:DNA-binding response OmpR family regulator
MKKLLLVDDDAMVMRAYRDRLSRHGFQVNTAADGAAAIALLQTAKPDVVVLDLLMPNVSGVEVLKFIRSQPRLAATPVIVLTNAYLNELGREAARIGIDKALLKAQCNPSTLMAAIDELILASKAAQSAPPPAEVSEPAATPDAAAAASKPPADAPSVGCELRQLLQAVAHAPAGPERLARFQELYREVHSLAALAGMNGMTQLARLAVVLEALLYVVIEKPALVSPSLMRTLASLVDFVELVFQRSGQAGPDLPQSAAVLVVDDDPLSNRLVVSALSQAQLEPRSTEDPVVAMQWLQAEKFDLVLLDIEMPGMSGFELCKALRLLPGYAKTPVVYLTHHNDFEHRVQSTLSGGDDLIAKPVLPMELAAKVVMHLLKGQMRDG